MLWHSLSLCLFDLLKAALAARFMLDRCDSLMRLKPRPSEKRLVTTPEISEGFPIIWSFGLNESIPGILLPLKKSTLVPVVEIVHSKPLRDREIC